MSTGSGERPRVVVVGGGVAALELALGLAEHVPGAADVELVTPDAGFTYRPHAVAETFGAGTPYRLELAKVAARIGATLREARVASVDAGRHVAVTEAGDEVPYDLLVIACGARAEEWLPDSLTFRGERDEEAFRALLDDVADGPGESVAFVVPEGASWPLPLYELALLTAAELRRRSDAEHRLSLVTAEQRPLAAFGEPASDAVAGLLADAGIALHASLGNADWVVTLPRLRGPGIAGLPADADGFVPVDQHGAVPGADDVWAAGDATTFPVKQGGIAVQQADAVAEAVAARLGASIRPAPFRPVLRGMLLTGDSPRFMQTDGDDSLVAGGPLWWPPSKIAGGWLARFLHAEGMPVPEPPGGTGAVPVELELSHTPT
jgi:sulfide:quinone oxidoreductase